MSQQSAEQEIKAIKGNGPALEGLDELLKSGEAIALVGAGASAGLWPLWDKFLRDFVDFGLHLGKITEEEAEFFKNNATQDPLVIAQQIRKKLDELDYFEHLEKTFSDIGKVSADTGGAYTATHRALLQLPIHNYLTLNYDAGLTNARAALYPNATTSYYFWDQEEAKRIRDRKYQRGVLHAHGRFDRAKSIILTQDDYHRAYSDRPFVRLLNSLFTDDKLLIVGFGLNDPYVKQLFNSISGDYKTSALQHIAFVGLKDEELPVVHLHRERVEMVYRARVVFYPSRDDHQALTDFLSLLAERHATDSGSRTAEQVQPLPTPPQLKNALPDKYVHHSTDDENFEGRIEDFITLNRWANDPTTRTIAVTGIGGQGKTAMVGHWLKHERSPELAGMPVFYWSFYEDQDVGKFLEQIVEFCLPAFPDASEQDVEPISFILSVVQQARLLLVLDGLEVLQEEAGSPGHGRIIPPLLQQFIRQWVRTKHQGLMLLTSRFRFPELERFSGVSFYYLNLVRLRLPDGVALLRRLHITGRKQLLEEYIKKLHGHPLALRILASTVKRSCFGDLEQFEGGSILTAAGEDDELGKKLKRLLGFYEEQLKDGQRELLGIVSLFKRPVESKNFLTLLSGMKSLADTPLAKASATQINKQLGLLIDDFIVEKTHEGITTHPIIRDYFREGCKITGSRREVADFLQTRPGATRPRNIKEVRDLVEAVQLLCDEGDFKAAHYLFSSRLTIGGYGFNVFINLLAIADGLECHQAFVRDDVRIENVEKMLGKPGIAFHYSGVALYNDCLGNLDQALKMWNKVLNIRRELRDKPNQASVLQEISLGERASGNLRQALDSISQALLLSRETKRLVDLSSESADKGYYESLLGNYSQAFRDFERSFCYFQREFADQKNLSSIWGNQQTEFLVRLQAWKQFEAVNAWNIRECEKYGWNSVLAVCHLLQGWYEICLGQLSQAEKALAKAECILRPSGMVQEICRLDWVWALLAEAKGEYENGLQRVKDSLFICADKGFRLWQADHLVLRGRLYLQKYQKEESKDLDLLEKAGDDANETLTISEQTGYVWPKVEALELLAKYHQTRATISDFNKQDEKETARRYTNEAESIKAGLFLTEKQMEELKIEARKEFEKQTADWDD